MSEGEPLGADLKGLEAQLAALRPTPPNVDRDWLMFAAGVESTRARRPLRRLRWSNVAFVAGAAMAFFLGHRTAQRDVPIMNVAPQAPPLVVAVVPPLIDPAIEPGTDLFHPVLAPASRREPESYGELRKQFAVADRIGSPDPASSAAGSTEPDAGSSLRRLQSEWLRSLN